MRFFLVAKEYANDVDIIPTAKTGPVNLGKISEPVRISYDASDATIIAVPLRAYDMNRNPLV